MKNRYTKFISISLIVILLAYNVVIPMASARVPTSRGNDEYFNRGGYMRQFQPVKDVVTLGESTSEETATDEKVDQSRNGSKTAVINLTIPDASGRTDRGGYIAAAFARIMELIRGFLAMFGIRLESGGSIGQAFAKLGELSTVIFNAIQSALSGNYNSEGGTLLGTIVSQLVTAIEEAEEFIKSQEGFEEDLLSLIFR